MPCTEGFAHRLLNQRSQDSHSVQSAQLAHGTIAHPTEPPTPASQRVHEQARRSNAACATLRRSVR